jgi:Trk K+ transport system NAD-binding subunit
VFCLAATKNIRRVMRELRRMDKSVKRIMIAGGGNIGHRLVRAIENDYQVKVIDRNKQHAAWLAENVRKALVLQGDATDEKLLDEENVDQMDIFLALTNDDENNIMAALLAKRMGAKRVAALINRRTYAELLEGSQIDIAISPAQTSIGTLLAHVRRGDVAAVHSLRRGAAEALELVAHGDAQSSQVVGRRIEDCPSSGRTTPPRALAAAAPSCATTGRRAGSKSWPATPIIRPRRHRLSSRKLVPKSRNSRSACFLVSSALSVLASSRCPDDIRRDMLPPRSVRRQRRRR